MLSMTGQGQAQVIIDDCRVHAEVRSVNNRFLKVVVRCGDSFSAFGPRIEKLVQQDLRRGSVNVNVKIEAEALSSGYRLNTSVMSQYYQQLSQLMGEQSVPDWNALLALPGVVDDSLIDAEAIEATWPVVAQAVQQALVHTNQMRKAEGEAMVRDLLENLQTIDRYVKEIQSRAPMVVTNYQNRLLDKMKQLLDPHQVSLEPSDIVREVGLYADRCDISEEVVRLNSHLEQFQSLLSAGESQGRKLDFLTQEMFREINTIGSKANDAEIAQSVVNVKTCIERIREMVQNIE